MPGRIHPNGDKIDCCEHRGRHHSPMVGQPDPGHAPARHQRPTATRRAPRGPATRQGQPRRRYEFHGRRRTSRRSDVGRDRSRPGHQPPSRPTSSSPTPRTRRRTNRSQDLAHAPASPTTTTQVVPPTRLLGAASLRGWGPAPPQRPPSSGAGSPKGLPERPHTHPAGSPRASDVHAPRRADGCTRHDQPGEMDGRRQSERPQRALPTTGQGSLPPAHVVGILLGQWRVLLVPAPNSWGTLITRSTVRTRVQLRLAEPPTPDQRIAVPNPPAHQAALAPRPFLATPSLAVRPRHQGSAIRQKQPDLPMCGRCVVARGEPRRDILPGWSAESTRGGTTWSTFLPQSGK